MSAAKVIVTVMLLLVAMHLLLYGFLRRRIEAAKRERKSRDD
jgi:hypothetical protein